MHRLLVPTLILAAACSETEELDPFRGPDVGRQDGTVGVPRDQGPVELGPDGATERDAGTADAGPEELGSDAGHPDGGAGGGPARYDFVKVTDSNTSDAPVGGVEPSIDGAGRVAWRTVAGGPSAQIRVGDGTGAEQVLYDAATSQEPLAFINIRRPLLNEGGQLVAQIETTAFVNTIVSGDGGPFTLIASEGDEPTFGDFSLNFAPDFADDGQVLFVDRSTEIWVGDGSARPASLRPDDLELFGETHLLSGGRAVLTARRGEEREEVIARVTGPDDYDVVVSETELTENMRLNGRLHASPDGQTVAFGLRRGGNPGAEGISIVDAGGLRTWVEPSEAYTPIQTIEVNARGAIVFISGSAGQPKQAIRQGPDAEDVVIEIEDELFGSTVTVLGFHAAGLNDAGQIAFSYCTELECGIARADPSVD